MNVTQQFINGTSEFGNLIVVCQTGSRAYGLETETSDWDYRGVFIPHNEYLIGLKTVDQIKIDGDCWVCHSIMHYIDKMIVQNPTLLELLYIDEPVFENNIWKQLKPELKKLVYRGAFKPYSAYIFSQLQKVRFRQPSQKRLELIQEFGYDTKYMSHVARLAIQCTILMKEHHIPIRVPEPYKTEVMKIKTGKMDKHDALMYCEELDKNMKIAYEESTLPDSINVNKFEKEVYMPLIKSIINRR